MTADPVRLGMVRLTDAAPVVLAHTRGLFAGRNLDVTVSVEPSWANVADKLAWGLLDGAVMLPPLAIAMAAGLRGPHVPLIVPACISLNGNAVTLASPLADLVLEGGPQSTIQAANRLRQAAAGRRPRLAVVHAFSTHDLLLRIFLERGGIDPAADVDIVVVPPAAMVDALLAGRIDGFCAGAPWGAVAQDAGAGRTVATTSEVWPGHPEKCLALRADWAAAHPDATLRLIAALSLAGHTCSQETEAPAISELLARPEWVGVPAQHIAASLPGGAGGPVDRSIFPSGPDAAPRPAHAAWMVQQMARWRLLPGHAGQVAATLYRPDLHEAAMFLPNP